MRDWLRTRLLDLLSADIELMITRELVNSDLDDVAMRAIADQRIRHHANLQAAARWGKD
jgi:hypothetical protein